MKKYKIYDNKTVEGLTLYRVQALMDFGDVCEGNVSGWLRNPYCIPQDDLSWVHNNCILDINIVLDNSQIYDTDMDGCGKIILRDSVIKNSYIEITDSFTMIQTSTIENCNINLNNSNFTMMTSSIADNAFKLSRSRLEYMNSYVYNCVFEYIESNIFKSGENEFDTRLMVDGEISSDI